MHSKLRSKGQEINTPATKVILIRHGQSTSNAQGRYQGSSDESVLTAKGHASAYETGVALKHLQVDAIYTSPLIRAQETTKEILAGLNKTRECLSVHINHHLQEICLPAWQGQTFAYVRSQFPDAYRCWQEQPHKFYMDASQAYAIGCAVQEKCFPVNDLYAQAKQFWQEILPHHIGQTLLVISHSGTNRALISTAIGLHSDRFHTLAQSNCGMSILHFPVRTDTNKVAFPQIKALNLTTHLGETLPKLKEGKQGLRLLLVPSDGIKLPQMERLAEFLKSVSIDFSLSSDLKICQQSAKIILQYHSPDLQFQVLPPELLQKCQLPSLISDRYKHDNLSLLTGLIIVSNDTIKRILGQLLGMQEDWHSLHLVPGTMSVIHYPQASTKAILQAVNINNAALPAILSTGST